MDPLPAHQLTPHAITDSTSSARCQRMGNRRRPRLSYRLARFYWPNHYSSSPFCPDYLSAGWVRTSHCSSLSQDLTGLTLIALAPVLSDYAACVEDFLHCQSRRRGARRSQACHRSWKVRHARQTRLPGHGSIFSHRSRGLAVRGNVARWQPAALGPPVRLRRRASHPPADAPHTAHAATISASRPTCKGFHPRRAPYESRAEIINPQGRFASHVMALRPPLRRIFPAGLAPIEGIGPECWTTESTFRRYGGRGPTGGHSRRSRCSLNARNMTNLLRCCPNRT